MDYVYSVGLYDAPTCQLYESIKSINCYVCLYIKCMWKSMGMTFNVYILSKIKINTEIYCLFYFHIINQIQM